ncbi:DUF1593 domain-containing protein [Tessaracoccus defluvii]|uniref:DUF1593 domain-containing protein n=1 Tax=Tessaracoccus defluvii TaxID=1285901 RepID=A0A7H0H2D6_9ACTN|nr:DUF1593 domain-containing protein [Tessaracoccus defluvii]QNP54702.1 DUF1593 domain-containing protein [Tessaracoccus defluvii]
MSTARGDDAAPRTIITTDPELDDLNSMLRLLLYSNEIDIVGLVYSSSQFHYAGDAAEGRPPFRWPAPGAVFHIDQAVDAYARVHHNLVVHDDRYPTPEHLRSLIAWGNVADVGDMAADTPGSDLIRRILLDDEPGRVFLQVWGGHNTVARALRSIQDEFGATPEWPRLRDRISAKAVVTSFGHQDHTFADYIRPNWPALESREVATRVWGYFARTVVADEDQHLLTAEWTRRNVTAVGPLGAEYRVWGDGKQMADGFDAEDYFGLSGLSADELAAQGYEVWMPPQEQGAFISEGDSSNFALLVDNGLRSWVEPGWGGWGGRQERAADDPSSWSNVDEWDSARWIGEFQNDFAARLRWSVEGEYAAANHHPVVRVVDGLERTAAAGDVVRLTAETWDPDGDEVRVEWWQYVEAGTSSSTLELDVVGETVSFVVPPTASPGERIHVICTARDSGTPTLTRHQRVVVTVPEE